MKITNLMDDSKMVAATFGEKYSGFEQMIGRDFGSKSIGFHVEVMNPKTFSCPYHFHTEEEELCIVLEGEAIVRCGDEFRKVRKGDLIYYGAGPDCAHHMYNHTENPFRFFILSTRAPNELCFYPDSGKQLDRKSRKVTKDGVEVDYLLGEEDPSKFWPEHALRGDVP
ncbi:hypothetical protein BH10BDE1_BH10BDE1_10210 [soil metagenome]